MSYPIYFPLCNLHQRNHIKTKFTQVRIYFNVSGQVHIVEKKASTKRGNLIDQVHNTEVKWSIKPCIVWTKKVSKALRQKLVEWTMKNSNVRESPIACDILLITDAESEVKRRVPKLLPLCSMQQFTMRSSLHQMMEVYLDPDTPIKMMCGCAICNTSKYF